MNIRRWATVVAGVLVVVVACAATLAVTAAPQQSAPVADPMAALLVEVHALRVAMERSGTVTPRVQLTLARLNMEEQRVAQLAGQLEQVRRELSSASRETARLSESIPEVEKTIENAPDERTRQGLEYELKEVKRRVKDQVRVEQDLRAREGEAAQVLATEQGRWIELNSRLDELERLLAPVPRE